MDFYADLKDADLSTYPTLLFYYNAVTNSLGCNCGGRPENAKNRYRTLISTINDNEKQFLKQRYNITELKLKQDNESYVIDL
jgi:hypothetical protein|tara:strand:- start:2480 stop:2725 length:246 start_codon:yes stop_codon:yes gene_type:complete